MACEEVEIAKLVLDAVAVAGAGIVFSVGLWQYRQAQLWRRKEFIGSEVGKFQADSRVQAAFLLIDWSTRKIPLGPETDRSKWPKITRSFQVKALEPHVLRPKPAETSSGTFRRYSQEEAEIRLVYDAFFDGLTRLEAFAESGLYEEQELLPYLEYWIEDLTTESGPAEDVEWRLALYAYIGFYRFRGVRRLFSKLGYDISVGGEIWRRLEKRATPELAARLEVAVLRGASGSHSG